MAIDGKKKHKAVRGKGGKKKKKNILIGSKLTVQVVSWTKNRQNGLQRRTIGPRPLASMNNESGSQLTSVRENPT